MKTQEDNSDVMATEQRCVWCRIVRRGPGFKYGLDRPHPCLFQSENRHVVSTKHELVSHVI